MMEYFKAMGTKTMGSLGKAIVLMAKVKYTCFSLFLSLATPLGLKKIPFKND